MAAVNVLVSARLNVDGAPARMLRSWLAGAFDLAVSPPLVRERSSEDDRVHGRGPEQPALEPCEQLSRDGKPLRDRHLHGAGHDRPLERHATAPPAALLLTKQREQRSPRQR